MNIKKQPCPIIKNYKIKKGFSCVFRRSTKFDNKETSSTFILNVQFSVILKTHSFSTDGKVQNIYIFIANGARYKSCLVQIAQPNFKKMMCSILSVSILSVMLVYSETGCWEATGNGKYF